MATRSVTPRGMREIIESEGLELRAYRDTAGLLTIGVGHLLTERELQSGRVLIDGEPVNWRDGITREQAMALLGQDLDVAEAAVERLAPGLADHQFDALVSFTFNVGVGALRESTLLQRIREGRLDDVPRQLMRWTKSGGRVTPGLVRRREREAALWRG